MHFKTLLKYSLIVICNVLLIPIEASSPPASKQPKICPGVHLRNDLKSFEQLRGCNIIDGPLTVALISNKTHPFQPKDFDTLTFPDLTEITEYLLFFRVEGLSTLSHLFPNLAVIRGNELVENYALIIYEMMHLQKINLPNLKDILRGSVRIESNPNLCVDTKAWDAISKRAFSPHFLKNNNRDCNASDESPSSLGGDCHEYCAGGCFEKGRSDKCVSCRYFTQGNDCRRNCDNQLYQYKGHCITEQECISMAGPVMSDQCVSSPKAENLKAIRLSSDKPGKCSSECPPGFEEDPINKNKCKLCDRGKCKKVCTSPQGSDKPFIVANVNSLRELSGCNVINGSLEISVKGGKNVLHELETAFQELEEIEGYLKITRSYPILTLGFLSKLKAINGLYQDRDQYSLIIIDNPNLQELFLYNKGSSEEKQLKISKGKIFVHLNPKLCPHRIDNLKSYASVADWDERDVSIHTNGDKEVCFTEKLEVHYIHGTARMAMIRFKNFASTMDDPRSLLYYLINYREANDDNVTMFDGRDGCNSQNDVWVTREVTPIETNSYSKKVVEYQDTAITVKPATRYALYIKTFTILAGSKGALSDVIYFSTAPDTPGIPRQIESSATSHDSVLVSWFPPSKPNGLIATYTITVTKIPELEDFQNINICNSVANRDKIAAALTKTEPTLSAFDLQPQTQNTTNSCSMATSDADVSEKVEVVSFQDLIIDIVYLKQPCLASKPPKAVSRKKRAPPVTVTENNIPSPQVLQFNRTIGKTEIPASPHKSDSKMAYVIKELEHFSLYLIEVVACHGNFLGNRSKPSADYNRCSLQAISQVRTLPIEENDKVLVNTIKFHPANESSEHSITWQKPEKPNGPILAYRVRYRPKNSFIWSESCLNHTAGTSFTLTHISPGTYLFSVQTVSLGSGRKFWSEPELEFVIPQNYIVSPTVLAILMVFGLILLAFAVAFGRYLYQKRRHDLKNGLVYASVNPDYIKYDPDEWEVDKSNLIIGEHVGTGAFGIVHKGQLISEKGTFSCAIKTLPATSTAKQRMDFLREASIMKQFDTHYVVKLMGVVSTSNPVYVIMEYMENGDLKSYLRRLREVHQREGKTLVDGIHLMAAQIADGMAYLASKKFVHRDLAARNCMVGENGVVKVGDFGLTRDIYDNEYYRRGTQGRLPVRWMAPESLLDNIYTSASDVWSYGIVVWEIVTFSAYPYQGLSNDEVIQRVCAGYTMSRPEHSSDKLYSIMQRCWRREPQERPTFYSLVEELLPDIEDKLSPDSFFKKNKTDKEANTQPCSEETNSGAESFPLISWTLNRINGLTNGVNHLQSDTV